MDTGSNTTIKKWPTKRIIILSVLVLLSLTGIYLYRNFNRILSEALLNSFNSSVISDVYELKFEDLRVNLLEGNIRVYHVSLLPRKKPLNEYSYINSSFSLKTENLLLESVDIRSLLKENRLILHKIRIAKPEIEFLLNGSRHIMLPFKDTTATLLKEKPTKRALAAFALREFQLIDAAFHVTNSYKQREFKIKDFNITLHDLQLDQQPGEYFTFVDQVTLAIGEFNGDLKKGAIQHMSFKDFKIGIDSLNLHLTLDTLMFQFHDFNTGIRDLEIQTKDSLFHISMKSFDLSYAARSVKLTDISFKPNVSHALLQRKHQFQNTELSGSVGKVEIREINFDSLIYSQKLFIAEIDLNNVKAAIFKDKTKPMDSTRRPVYLGQTVRALSLPLHIRLVKATDVELENTERKPDSTYAKVNITRAKLEAKNITNLSTSPGLAMQADAHINGTAHFKATLTFSYQKPQFSFEGAVEKFDLPDLNPLIQAYTPAKINKGVADEIAFSGVAEQTKASGTMKFLYHDLEVDLELKEQAKWKSSVIAFAANAVVNSSNPVSTDLPNRIVQFQIERDMTKGFVNVVIKSILNGVKETMIMSKDNRKTYQETKKKSKAEK